MRRLAINGPMDGIFQSQNRYPKFQVQMFDLLKDPFYNFSLNMYKQTPIDLTDFVEEISLEESVENESSVSIKLKQSGAYPLPHMFVGQRVIQVLISDERLDTDKWYKVFTGPCIGQPGWSRNRDSSGGTISLKCVGRGFYFNKQTLNTREYNAGEDFGNIGVEIACLSVASGGMGLIREEVLFGSNGSTNQHSIASIRDVPFFEGFDNLFFIPNLRLSFNGEGKLVAHDKSIYKPPVIIFPDDSLIKAIEWPNEEVNCYNAVEVVGLSSVAVKNVHSSQVLATVRGSIGFFIDEQEIEVYYSEDHRQRCDDVRITNKKLDGWGIKSTKAVLEEVDEFHSILIIKGKDNKWIFVLWVVIYLVFIILAAILNGIPWIGGILSGALWILAGVWLTLGLQILMQLGTYEIEISGKPYEYVYKEVRAEKWWGQIYNYEKRQLVIENHFVYSEALAADLAQRELIYETIKKCPRQGIFVDNPALEPDDIIEFSDGSRWYVYSISRTYKRDSSSESLMSVNGWLCRSGPEYAGRAGWSMY